MLRRQRAFPVGPIAVVAMVVLLITATTAACSRAVKPSVPPLDQIVSCETDTPPVHGHDIAASVADGCRDLTKFLSVAHRVDKQRWLHGYSHVALMDRSGRIVLRDGRTLRWMLRPGGLGYLEDALGERSYLVSCQC